MISIKWLDDFGSEAKSCANRVNALLHQWPENRIRCIQARTLPRHKQQHGTKRESRETKGSTSVVNCPAPFFLGCVIYANPERRLYALQGNLVIWGYGATAFLFDFVEFIERETKGKPWLVNQLVREMLRVFQGVASAFGYSMHVFVCLMP